MELWERDGVKPSDDWSSLIFCRVYRPGEVPTDMRREGAGVQPLGFIFVIEPARADPKHKLSGGHCRKGETPLETAMREMHGETGLEFPSDRFLYVNSLWRHHPSPHWSILFCVNAEMEDIPWMTTGHPENEGEIPKFVGRVEFGNLVRRGGILPPHLRRLEDAGLVLLADA